MEGYNLWINLFPNLIPFEPGFWAGLKDSKSDIIRPAIETVRWVSFEDIIFWELLSSKNDSGICWLIFGLLKDAMVEFVLNYNYSDDAVKLENI